MFRDPKTLSSRAVKILQWMADNEHDEVLIKDRLSYWWGLERTGYKTVAALLECCFISWNELCNGYTINDSGKRFLQGEKPYRDSDGNYHETMLTMPDVRQHLTRRK